MNYLVTHEIAGVVAVAVAFVAVHLSACLLPDSLLGIQYHTKQSFS